MVVCICCRAFLLYDEGVLIMSKLVLFFSMVAIVVTAVTATYLTQRTINREVVVPITEAYTSYLAEGCF